MIPGKTQIDKNNSYHDLDLLELTKNLHLDKAKGKSICRDVVSVTSI